MTEPNSHFKGKSAIEHLKEARKKAHHATSEMHGTEPPGDITAGADNAKQTAFLSLILVAALSTIGISFSHIAIIFGGTLLGWILWKVTRTSLIGWSRLEKFNRLIAEEKHEISHHREEEKEELTEIYKAKGFSGKLLDDVIDVLMADDNRLLQLMLEEEMGIELSSLQHPLKQAFGTFIGILSAAAIIAFFGLIAKVPGIIAASLLITTISSWMMAKVEENAPLNYVVCDIAALGASSLLTTFLVRALI